MVSSILHWVHSKLSCSVLTSFWIHWSVSIVSSKAQLFCSSSDSLLTFLARSISASLCMASLHFPCSVRSSGLFFRWECLLVDFLSNWSIAWFIISWNSLMNAIWPAFRFTSDKLSSSSSSSWSLSWSGGDSFVTSHCCTFPVWLLDSPVTSHLSVKSSSRQSVTLLLILLRMNTPIVNLSK